MGDVTVIQLISLIPFTHCTMVTTPPDLGAVLEAPATIPAATALTICSIKAGSENGFDPATGSTSGGILSSPYLFDTSGMDTSA